MYSPIAKSLLPMALLVLLLGGCTEKLINDGGNGGNVSLTAKFAAPDLVEMINTLQLTAWGNDMDTMVAFQQFNGYDLSFVMDIPAGANRHFLLEAIESRDVAAPRVIYRGHKVVAITPDRSNAVSIPMYPVLPIIKLNPTNTAIPCGESFQLELETYGMVNLQGLQADVYFDGYFITLDTILKGVTPGDSAAIQYWMTDGGLGLTATDTSFYPASDIVTETGYSHLATLYFDTRVAADTITDTPKRWELLLYPVEYWGGDSANALPLDFFVHHAYLEIAPLEDKIITFADSALSRAVKSRLEMPPEVPLHLSEALTIETFYGFEPTIRDLTGLEQLANLREVELTGTQVSDMSPVAGLKKLTRFHFQGSLVEDITALAGLTRLVDIDLGDNSIVNISPLIGLTELCRTNLSSNQISDVYPLVQNVGLGTGDTVWIYDNPLNTDAVTIHIPALRARGVIVHYEPTVR